MVCNQSQRFACGFIPELVCLNAENVWVILCSFAGQQWCTRFFWLVNCCDFCLTRVEHCPADSVGAAPRTVAVPAYHQRVGLLPRAWCFKPAQKILPSPPDRVPGRVIRLATSSRAPSRVAGVVARLMLSGLNSPQTSPMGRPFGLVALVTSRVGGKGDSGSGVSSGQSSCSQVYTQMSKFIMPMDPLNPACPLSAQ